MSVNNPNNFIQDSFSRRYRFSIPKHWHKESISFSHGINMIGLETWIEENLNGFWNIAIEDTRGIDDANICHLYFEEKDDILLFALGGGMDFID